MEIPKNLHLSFVLNMRLTPNGSLGSPIPTIPMIGLGSKCKTFCLPLRHSKSIWGVSVKNTNTGGYIIKVLSWQQILDVFFRVQRMKGSLWVRVVESAFMEDLG